MNGSREDQKFVAKTLDAVWKEATMAAAKLCLREITKEEYQQITEKELTKYLRLLLDWKSGKMDIGSKKYSWSYYDEDEGYWFHNTAYFEPPFYYGTREQAEQAAQYFLKNNPHYTKVRVTEHNL